MINAKAFRGLSPDVRAGIERAHKEAGVYSHKLMQEAADTVVSSVNARNAKFTELDIKPLVAKTAELYARENKEGRMPKGFLEAVEAARK
jgi:TRAP-type C4-dicarboxylate transport system substrate-binding protein